MFLGSGKQFIDSETLRLMFCDIALVEACAQVLP